MSNCSKLPNFISQRAPSVDGETRSLRLAKKVTCVFLGSGIIRCTLAAAARALKCLKPIRGLQNMNVSSIAVSDLEKVKQSCPIRQSDTWSTMSLDFCGL